MCPCVFAKSPSYKYEEALRQWNDFIDIMFLSECQDCVEGFLQTIMQCIKEVPCEIAKRIFEYRHKSAFRDSRSLVRGILTAINSKRTKSHEYTHMLELISCIKTQAIYEAVSASLGEENIPPKIRQRFIRKTSQS